MVDDHTQEFSSCQFEGLARTFAAAVRSTGAIDALATAVRKQYRLTTPAGSPLPHAGCEASGPAVGSASFRFGREQIGVRVDGRPAVDDRRWNANGVET